ncbi:MAG: DNA repair protein RecO, partial [Thermodesulfobacteriota bacterium]
MQDIDLFMSGSFILENVVILLPEEDPNERMFNLLVDTLSALDSKKSPSNVMLKFQLSALSLAGYEPNFDVCVACKNVIEGDGFFSIQRGGIVCNKCESNKSNGFRISNDFLLAQKDWMKGQQKFLNHELKDPLEYIKLLVKFTQYRTGKEIKSSKFLEELKND